MMNLYQNQSTKTQPILMQLLSEKSSNLVGSVSYSGFASKIMGGKQGNNADIEEIEFTYLHYLLNDQLILMWSAFGGTGLSKIDSLAQMSGVIIAETDMTEYGTVENIIGQLGHINAKLSDPANLWQHLDELKKMLRPYNPRYSEDRFKEFDEEVISIVGRKMEIEQIATDLRSLLPKSQEALKQIEDSKNKTLAGYFDKALDKKKHPTVKVYKYAQHLAAKRVDLKKADKSLQFGGKKEQAELYTNVSSLQEARKAQSELDRRSRSYNKVVGEYHRKAWNSDNHQLFDAWAKGNPKDKWNSEPRASTNPHQN